MVNHQQDDRSYIDNRYLVWQIPRWAFQESSFLLDTLLESPFVHCRAMLPLQRRQLVRTVFQMEDLRGRSIIDLECSFNSLITANSPKHPKASLLTCICLTYVYFLVLFLIVWLAKRMANVAFKTQPSRQVNVVMGPFFVLSHYLQTDIEPSRSCSHLRPGKTLW